MSLSQCPSCGGHIPLGPHASNCCESCGLGVFGTPARTDAQVLDSVRRNIEMARDLTALKLATLKSGSSSAKTTAGMLRAFNECLGVIESEGGQA